MRTPGHWKVKKEIKHKIKASELYFKVFQVMFLVNLGNCSAGHVNLPNLSLHQMQCTAKNTSFSDHTSYEDTVSALLCHQ